MHISHDLALSLSNCFTDRMHSGPVCTLLLMLRATKLYIYIAAHVLRWLSEQGSKFATTAEHTEHVVEYYAERESFCESTRD